MIVIIIEMYATVLFRLCTIKKQDIAEIDALGSSWKYRFNSAPDLKAIHINI